MSPSKGDSKYRWLSPSLWDNGSGWLFVTWVSEDGDADTAVEAGMQKGWNKIG